MLPTMEDVAVRAGVAKSTVSLVLNGKPGVSPQIQHLVWRAAHDLGYKLPQRRLKKAPSTQKTVTVVHACYERTKDTAPAGLFLQYLAGIQACVRKQNVNLNLITNYREREDSNLAHLLLMQESSSDGLILMGTGVRRDSDLIRQVLARQIPTVALSRTWPDLPICTVSQDHRQQAQIALDHLVRLGHRRIAFIAREIDQHYDWFALRLDCYRKAMTELHGEADPNWIAIGVDGVEAVKKLITRTSDVTAIVGVNDSRAVEALCGLRESGIAVPDAISVVGLDDSKSSPDGYPALTTVAYSHFDLGYVAADLILKMFTNDQILYSNVTMRSYLIERESCQEYRP